VEAAARAARTPARWAGVPLPLLWVWLLLVGAAAPSAAWSQRAAAVAASASLSAPLAQAAGAASAARIGTWQAAVPAAAAPAALVAASNASAASAAPASSAAPGASGVSAASTATATATATATQTVRPWWVWSAGLFFACALLGIVAVPAGIGGGTLFVPIVGSFFPFHLDYVRGAGLLVALASALSAGPMLLRGGLASVRLALPLGLLASVSSIAGAMIGMALPAAVVQTMLGAVVLAIVALMLVLRQGDGAITAPPDRLAQALGLHGVFLDGASGRPVRWLARHTGIGLLLFMLIGLLGGLFGIGAGWANVPVLNLLMGLPLKVAAGTSGLVLSLASGSAVWVYLNQGAILPLIALPAVLGMMIGARIGARLLHVLSGVVLRRLVIGVLLFAGLRALLKGTGVWP